MGLFNRRELKELREANAHLLEIYKKSQDELADARENYENCQRVIDSNNETYRRMKKRINAMQKIIDSYRDKYGEIRPPKQHSESKPIGYHKERKTDHDPYPSDKDNNNIK